MPFMTLAVSPRVILQVSQGHEYQKQLAIRGASCDLLALIEKANKRNRVTITVCGAFELEVGDTGAIWGAHQTRDIQMKDFANLYSLLATRPDIPVTFRW